MNTEEAQALLASAHGWLARGDWKKAREAFETVRARVEEPEVLEGLGVAAWWLDDDETVFEARARAYQLYRQRDDRRGAARMAMMIAMDSFHFRGQTSVARGWQRRAARLLEGLPPAPEHAWLRVWDCELSLATGQDAARVREVATEAIAIGRELGDPDAEMMALSLEGLALVTQGAVEDGMRRLDEAATAALSGDMLSPLAIGISCCHLVTACEIVRDFRRAAEWCDRVREFSARVSWSVLSYGVPDPARRGVDVVWSMVRRGSRARAGHPAPGPGAASHARATAGPVGGAASTPGSVRGGRGAAPARRLASRRPAGAGRHGPRSRQGRVGGGPRPTVPGAGAAVQQDRSGVRRRASAPRRASARTPDARTLEDIQALAASVGTEPLRASARIAEGLIARASDKHEHARAAFEDAIGVLARAGSRYETARARVDLAGSLLALHRAEAARAELDRAGRVFEELGAAWDARRARALMDESFGEHQAAPERARPGRLSARELEVLRLMAEGLSNPQIAKRLIVSEFTVKRHVANILTKLDLPTRAAAAAYAAREGWV